VFISGIKILQKELFLKIKLYLQMKKVEYYSYSIEYDLIGNTNHIVLVLGDALRYIDTPENFYAQETYTIVKKGSGTVRVK